MQFDTVIYTCGGKIACNYSLLPSSMQANVNWNSNFKSNDRYYEAHLDEDANALESALSAEMFHSYVSSEHVFEALDLALKYMMPNAEELAVKSIFESITTLSELQHIDRLEITDRAPKLRYYIDGIKNCFLVNEKWQIHGFQLTQPKVYERREIKDLQAEIAKLNPTSEIGTLVKMAENNKRIEDISEHGTYFGGLLDDENLMKLVYKPHYRPQRPYLSFHFLNAIARGKNYHLLYKVVHESDFPLAFVDAKLSSSVSRIRDIDKDLANLISNKIQCYPSFPSI